MVSSETKAVVVRAKEIYADRLQKDLEANHENRFVSIEPESGGVFPRRHIRPSSPIGTREIPNPIVTYHSYRSYSSISHWSYAVVKGLFDEQLRALVNVPVACSVEGQRKEIAVWVDAV